MGGDLVFRPRIWGGGVAGQQVCLCEINLQHLRRRGNFHIWGLPPFSIIYSLIYQFCSVAVFYWPESHRNLNRPYVLCTNLHVVVFKVLFLLQINV